ncbi:MAG: peroxiredoxin [Verrucomicrobiales bacterium]|nr:peroxiredoxin [Verrucomicrobiales bacterium]
MNSNQGPYTSLPANLPVPRDDGSCRHLPGTDLPDVSLLATSGEWVQPRQRPGLVVLYTYPMTGRPGVALPEGWDQIPGARGCTPQACSFRDHHAEMRRLGAEVFGLSSQSTEYQREVHSRLHLPFPLLSDETFAFADALQLPTFVSHGVRLLKRLTLIVVRGRIEHVFYPIFPPDRHIHQVLQYLEDQRRG